MLEAMGWALLGASSLLIGALIAFAVRIADRLLGFILAFGAGVLISAALLTIGLALALAGQAAEAEPVTDWHALAHRAAGGAGACCALMSPANGVTIAAMPAATSSRCRILVLT